MKFFVWDVSCVISNRWLDFGADPDHDVDRGTFGNGSGVNFAGNSRNLSTNSC